jgi:hypothetical protein
MTKRKLNIEEFKNLAVDSRWDYLENTIASVETDATAVNTFQQEHMLLMRQEMIAQKQGFDIEKDKMKAKIDESEAERSKAEAERTKAEDERTKAEDERTKAEDERKKAEDELKVERSSKQQIQADFEDLKIELEFQEKCLTGNKTPRHDSIVKLVKIDNPLFKWNKPNLSDVKSLWDIVKELVTEDDEKFVDENRDLHPVFKKVMDLITSYFQVLRTWHVRPRMNLPLAEPDLVGTNSGMITSSWSDAETSGELKLPQNPKKKEGVSEALEYLKYSFNACNKESEISLVAFYSDWESVLCFMCNDAKFSHTRRSDKLSLFPQNWRQLPDPTPGFVILCHCSLKPLRAQPLVKIGRINYPVMSNLMHEDGMGVFVVQVSGDRFVVKVGHGRRTKGYILSEKQRAIEISQIKEMENFMVPLLLNYDVEFGFAMKSGVVLASWMENCRNNCKDDENAVFAEVRNCLLNAFDGLLVLHEHNWYHLDIRPGNIVVINNKAMFIDWTTACHKEDYENQKYLLRQGHNDAFWPSYDSNVGPALDDWYGLVYTLAFVGGSMENRRELSNYATRDSFIQTLAEDESQHRSIVGRAALMIQKLSQHTRETLDKEIYDDLIAILNKE